MERDCRRRRRRRRPDLENVVVGAEGCLRRAAAGAPLSVHHHPSAPSPSPAPCLLAMGPPEPHDPELHFSAPHTESAILHQPGAGVMKLSDGEQRSMPPVTTALWEYLWAIF
jgi:hypothetical protein